MILCIYCNEYVSPGHVCTPMIEEYVSKKNWDAIEAKHKAIGQRKSHSILESIVNTIVGFGINFTANMLIFPLFGFHISPAANFLMGMIYTGISIARSYVLRRVFNGIMIKGKI